MTVSPWLTGPTWNSTARGGPGGGTGVDLLSPTPWLLVYWMARHHGLLPASAPPSPPPAACEWGKGRMGHYLDGWCPSLAPGGSEICGTIEGGTIVPSSWPYDTTRLEAAKAWCCEHEDCGGVTLEAGRYEVRSSSTPTADPAGSFVDASWSRIRPPAIAEHAQPAAELALKADDAAARLQARPANAPPAVATVAAGAAEAARAAASVQRPCCDCAGEPLLDRETNRSLGVFHWCPWGAGRYKGCHPPPREPSHPDPAYSCNGSASPGRHCHSTLTLIDCHSLGIYTPILLSLRSFSV